MILVHQDLCYGLLLLLDIRQAVRVRIVGLLCLLPQQQRVTELVVAVFLHTEATSSRPPR